jgi:hypothetical protein
VRTDHAGSDPGATAQETGQAATETVRRWLAQRALGGEAPLGGGDAAAELVRRARLSALAAATTGCATGTSGGGAPGLAKDPAWAAARRNAIAADLSAQRASETAVRLVRDAGVDCVTIKGPAFATQAFGDSSLRGSCDVDLLIRRRDLAAVRVALAEAGLQGAAHYPEWYEEHWHDHAAFVGRVTSQKMTVEVHWDIVHAGLSTLPVDEILATQVDVACGATTLPAPSLAWQVVITAAHATRHWFDARSLVDVAFVAHRLDDGGWGRAVDCARRAALGPALYYAVRLSSRWLEWEPPPTVEALRPPRLQDAVATRFIAGLSPWPGTVTWRVMQVAKLGTPATASARLCGLPGALIMLTDRPNVYTAGDRKLRALLGRHRLPVSPRRGDGSDRQGQGPRVTGA